MSSPDFNQLLALDVLLSEGSVARAARKLKLSPSAMSRSLARLRKTMGDPLLVRAGRVLVPTPRAMQIREDVHQLVQGSRSILQPAERLDLRQLVRTFTIRTSEGFAENFGPLLLKRIANKAPGMHLHFIQKPDRESSLLRDGEVDLETGVIGKITGPELRTAALFRDRFAAVVRTGHPLASTRLTRSRYLKGQHILVSRSGLGHGPVEEALRAASLRREVGVIVGGFSTALALARETDLIATVPERHTGVLRRGMRSFPLPIPIAPITISLLWHPRLDADQAHSWLRAQVREVCMSRSL